MIAGPCCVDHGWTLAKELHRPQGQLLKPPCNPPGGRVSCLCALGRSGSPYSPVLLLQCCCKEDGSHLANRQQGLRPAPDTIRWKQQHQSDPTKPPALHTRGMTAHNLQLMCAGWSPAFRRICHPACDHTPTHSRKCRTETPSHPPPPHHTRTLSPALAHHL